MIERSKRIELRVTAEELRQIHERMQETGISSLTAHTHDPNGNSWVCD